MTTQRQSERSNALLQAALGYAQRGWRVFPLHNPELNGQCSCGRDDLHSFGKHPRIKEWQRHASKSSAVVRAWWEKWPHANIAIVTGLPSGIVVLDSDFVADAPEGYSNVYSLLTLEHQYGQQLPATLCAETGGGGRHLLYAHPGKDHKLPNTTGLCDIPHLDVRGDGGFIVAPPSLHISGARYEWMPEQLPIAPLPEWLLPLLEREETKDSESAEAESAEISTPSARPTHFSQENERSSQEIGRHWLEHYLSNVSEGNRNNTGMFLAAQLRDNLLSMTEAEAFMLEYAQRVPGKGYSQKDALATLKSIYSRPPRQPAQSKATSISSFPSFPSSTHSAPVPFPSRSSSPSSRHAPVTATEEAVAGHVPYNEDERDHAFTGSTRSREEQQEQPFPSEPPQQRKEQKKARFQFLTDADVESLPAPEWLIKGVLPAERLSVVYGEYGSCKSFLTLDWALSIATGTAWLNHAVSRGTVVYIAGEGLGGLGKRIRAWKLMHNIHESVPLRILGVAPQLLRMEDVTALADAIRQLPDAPTFIVIDTLARSLVGGDENSQKDMGVAVASADYLRQEFHAHVLIVHHKPNNGVGGVSGGNGRTRGSSALPGAADTLIDVTKDHETVTVACAKQKDAAGFARHYLTLRTVALDEYADETSCVLMPRTLQTAQERETNSTAERLLRMLNSFPAGTATHGEWWDVAERAGIARRTFDYNLSILEKSSRITHDHELWKVVGASASAT